MTNDTPPRELDCSGLPRYYKLPFDFRVIAELSVAPDWYFITIYREGFQDYATYQCTASGNCYWGHYDISNRDLALADMLKRSPITIPDVTHA